MTNQGPTQSFWKILILVLARSESEALIERLDSKKHK